MYDFWLYLIVLNALALASNGLMLMLLVLELMAD